MIGDQARSSDQGSSGIQIVAVPDPKWGPLAEALATVLGSLGLPVNSKVANIKDRESAAIHAVLIGAFTNPAIIILLSHARPECFGTQDGSVTFYWEEFAEAVDLVKSEKVLLLLGCQTGKGSVADRIFNNSTSVAGVIGVPEETAVGDLIVASTMLFHSIARRALSGTTIDQINAFLGKEVLRDFNRGSWKVHLYKYFGL